MSNVVEYGWRESHDFSCCTATEEALPADVVPAPDMVNHPPHYNGHPKGIECIDVIEDNPFLNLGTAMKYLWRVSWGSKGRDEEDLEKAVWFIKRELSRRKKRSGDDEGSQDLSR